MSAARFKVGQPVMTAGGAGIVEAVTLRKNQEHDVRVGYRGTFGWFAERELRLVFAVGDRVAFVGGEGLISELDLECTEGLSFSVQHDYHPDNTLTADWYAAEQLTWLSSAPKAAATQGAQLGAKPAQATLDDDGYEFSVGDDVSVSGSRAVPITRRIKSTATGRPLYQIAGMMLYVGSFTLVMPVDEASAARHRAAGRTWEGMGRGACRNPDVFNVADIYAGARLGLAGMVRYVIVSTQESVKCRHVHCSTETTDATGFCSDRCLDFQGARDLAEQQLKTFASAQHFHKPEREWAEAKTRDALALLETRFLAGFNKAVET